MTATSANRISEQSTPAVNDRIRRETDASVAFYARHPELIDQRLHELDQEWDTERVLELNSSALSLVGMIVSATVSRKWLVLPMAVQGFFLQHGIEGYCPPLPMIRRLGVRSQVEIEKERHALKALRGDYANLGPGADATAVMQATGLPEHEPGTSSEEFNSAADLISSTTGRVPLNTSTRLNERVRRDIEKRVVFYSKHTELIAERLEELDHEWDVERLIETEAPSMTLTGLLLSAVSSRKWLALPLFAQSMVLLHAVQGWYPLLPLFRKMGFRTEYEIAVERYALKALRGDFADIAADQPDAAAAAVR